MADLLSDGARDAGRADESRSATWLELFFDVIFVINIAGLTHHLVAHPDLATLAQVAELYLPLFLVWAGHTTYATRFDDGSILQTILTLLLMFTLAGSAVFVQSGMDEHAESFARAQFAARVLLVLLYLEAHLRVPAARRFTWFLMIGFALSAVAWGAQGWTAAPWDRRLYAAAVGIELLAPLLAVSGLGHRPAHPTHLPERLGLFTIIVLGEAVLGVVVGGVRAEARLAVAIGFSLPVGIWWFYFRLLDRSELRERVGGGQLLTHLHLPMTLAVVVMAAAVEVSLVGLSAADSEAEGGGEPGMLEAVRHMIVLIRADVQSVAGGAGLARLASGTVLSGARLLFGGMAVWLTCFLAMRVYVVGLRRLGAAEWVTAGAVAALAAGAALIGPVRSLGLFIFAGALLLALAALGSLLQELRRRGAASPASAP
ncbi:MAG: low temperature requirement protein A [Spirochaetaceae bacterium]|nr:low temperature requirement protein A [Spirochaetaceae bacterium]